LVEIVRPCLAGVTGDRGAVVFIIECGVHFHVPVYVEDLDGFSSTQPFVRAALALHRQQARSPHLEVETYTWLVLPAHARDVPIDEAIARELHWVQRELA